VLPHDGDAGMTLDFSGLRAALRGRYDLQRVLGVGGMATVYLARDLRHERDVALKVLPAELAESVGRDRFLHEIRVAARLSHPHILPLYDSGEVDGFLFYVMPVMRGQSFRELLRAGPLPVAEAVRLVSDVADALDYAHRHNVVHRDIKPENLLLQEGLPLVADFGIGKAMAATATAAGGLTQVGTVVGTPAYMSPEQSTGDPHLDGRSDQYSLGVVLFELLSGVLPYQAPTVMAMLLRRLSEAAPSVRALRPEVPPALDDVLRRTLDRDPERRPASGAELARELRAALVTPATGWPAVSMPAADRERASVAVLPFANRSADPENAFFADGITDDVIAQLSKIRALKVISRTSAMAFKDRQHSLGEIARQLRVATVLEGSVRRAGNRVRIVAQLADAATESPIWSETYDRDLNDIFAIQSEVALAIAQALRAELTPAERGRIARRPTDDIEAYQLCVRGRLALMQYTEVQMRAGIDYLERAIRKDQHYALAHALLAFAYRDIAGTSGAFDVRADEAIAKAKRAIAQAMADDPDLGMVHTVAAYITCTCDFDWQGGERAFQRAIELDPGNADAWDLYGQMLGSMTRYDDALVVLRKAQELDPLAHRTDVANVLTRAGRYEEAYAAIAPVVELEPTYPRAQGALGWALILGGRVAEGIAALERAVALAVGDTMYLAQLGQAYGLSGELARAREILHQLEALARTRYVSPYHLAYVHVGLGEHGRALDLLEQAYEERSGAIYGIKGSFLFAPLRGEGRFGGLLGRMNLG